MNDESKIELVLEQKIRKGNKDFIIYPFGTFGHMVRPILNVQYGLNEKYVIDNRYNEYMEAIIVQ